MLFRCPSNSSSKCWLLSKYLFSHGILSALGFWNIEFDELDFLSISKSNFAGYTGRKNLIQTRQKFQFIKLDFLNSIFQNPMQIDTVSGQLILTILKGANLIGKISL